MHQSNGSGRDNRECMNYPSPLLTRPPPVYLLIPIVNGVIAIVIVQLDFIHFVG